MIYSQYDGASDCSVPVVRYSVNFRPSTSLTSTYN